MPIIPSSVREEVRRRSGGLCEDCKGPGNWRGLSQHEEPHRSQVARRYVYKANEVFDLCYKCHSARHGIMELLS